MIGSHRALTKEKHIMPKNFVKIAGRVLPFFILIWLAGCGGGGSNNAAGGATPSTGGITSPSPSLALFAGDMQVSGSNDGVGAAARLYVPQGIATDSAGNIYVADFGNDTIRKITPEGVVSTVVGVVGQPGFTPGPLPGMLSNPIGVAVSGTSLYILLNNSVVVNNRIQGTTLDAEDLVSAWIANLQ
ncbi:MAG: NHL domain-containing protein [Sulfuricaulis sp.]